MLEELEQSLENESEVKKEDESDNEHGDDKWTTLEQKINSITNQLAAQMETLNRLLERNREGEKREGELTAPRQEKSSENEEKRAREKKPWFTKVKRR